MFEKIVNDPGEVGQRRIRQVFQHIITMKSVKGSIVFITFLQRQSNALVARRRGDCSSGSCLEMSHLGFLSPKEEERRRKWKFLKESEGRLAEFGEFACQQSETLVPPLLTRTLSSPWISRNSTLPNRYGLSLGYLKLSRLELTNHFFVGSHD